VIHIIDYGLGNIQAFVNMYKRLGFDTVRACTVEDLNGAIKIILPGVGAFDHAMGLLNTSGMRQKLDELVLGERVPVLGICVGMQILANASEEGGCAGLGWIPGHVKSFAGNPASADLPMPHMGWNDVIPKPSCPLFNGMENNPRFYFLHSYYFEAEDVSQVAAQTGYGFAFQCAVQSENVFGVQFHPEKSHHWGAALLKNFAEL